MLLPTTLYSRVQENFHGNSGSIIKREDYSEGYTIIVADLTPFEIGDNFDLKAEGTLSIDFVFKRPLVANINVLVYAECDNVIETDSNRNVIKDWSKLVMNTFHLAQVLMKDTHFLTLPDTS